MFIHIVFNEAFTIIRPKKIIKGTIKIKNKSSPWFKNLAQGCLFSKSKFLVSRGIVWPLIQFSLEQSLWLGFHNIDCVKYYYLLFSLVLIVLYLKISMYFAHQELCYCIWKINNLLQPEIKTTYHNFCFCCYILLCVGPMMYVIIV